MHPLLLLGIYSLLCVVASLSGGWVPLVVTLTHRRMQIAISFVSGMILGIGLLHLLPDSLEILGSIDHVVGWVLAGFLFMFFLERFFHFHHHDVPEGDSPVGEALAGATITPMPVTCGPIMLTEITTTITPGTITSSSTPVSRGRRRRSG